MSKQKISKEAAKKRIEKTFSDVKNKSPEEIWKAKKLAMKNRVNLKEEKKTFCKKCFKPYVNPKIRINKGYKVLTCENCGQVKRIKL